MVFNPEHPIMLLKVCQISKRNFLTIKCIGLGDEIPAEDCHDALRINRLLT